ncbi:AMP-binding enzyme [Gregarina niphandrodes]|uniref:AMP-binding enzyme n=1 Tax=Gregarina niphandrodes TaxID=110365 RepID=A0A023BC70_GRENI|nr:AMP-binding enzyme [Gregarina niphandrodes]EZG82418.1 AMP-binding enzyme [Gregarina niphandrodes]|eukprot:XP_011128987.1 AMP-binding enzyme [Gregarina niphandrodes]
MKQSWTLRHLYGRVLESKELVLFDKSDPQVPAGLALRGEELDRIALDVAAQLDTVLSAGLPKTSVAVVMPNGADYVAVFLGIACGRGINCLLNPKYQEAEIVFAIQDLKCAAVVTGFQELPEAVKAAKTCGIPCYRFEWMQLYDRWTLGLLDQASGELAESRKDYVKKYHFPTDLTGFDIALKLHTSGTTSKPKTVSLRHCNIVATCVNQRLAFEWNKERDHSFLIMPLFHVHGLFNGCLGPLAAGCKVTVISSKSFSKSVFWKELKESGANMITAVPSMWQILLLDPEAIPKHLQPIRYIRSCSSAMAPAVITQLTKVLNTRVVESYAMTEATHQMLSTRLQESSPGMIGWPTGTEVVIVNPATQTVCPFNEPGEICVRGHNVITSYEGLSEEQNQQHFYLQADLKGFANGASFATSAPAVRETAGHETGHWLSEFEEDLKTYCVQPLSLDPKEARIEQPFLRTGDLGVMNERGCTQYISRLKELINRGGEKIAPIEIDATYLKIDSVKNAASFGYPDTILGECVAIAVVPMNELLLPGSADQRPDQPTPTDHIDDVQTWVNSIHEEAKATLSKFKIPIKTFVVKELPTGPTGKVLRRELNNFVKSRPCF